MSWSVGGLSGGADNTCSGTAGNFTVIELPTAVPTSSPFPTSSPAPTTSPPTSTPTFQTATARSSFVSCMYADSLLHSYYSNPGSYGCDATATFDFSDVIASWTEVAGLYLSITGLTGDLDSGYAYEYADVYVQGTQISDVHCDTDGEECYASSTVSCLADYDVTSLVTTGGSLVVEVTLVSSTGAEVCGSSSPSVAANVTLKVRGSLPTALPTVSSLPTSSPLPTQAPTVSSLPTSSPLPTSRPSGAPTKRDNDGPDGSLLQTIGDATVDFWSITKKLVRGFLGHIF